MTPLNVTMMVLIPLAIAAVLGVVAFSGHLKEAQRRTMERALSLGVLVLLVGVSGWTLVLAIQLRDWFAIAGIAAFALLVGVELARGFRRAGARGRTSE